MDSRACSWRSPPWRSPRSSTATGRTGAATSRRCGSPPPDPATAASPRKDLETPSATKWLSRVGEAIVLSLEVVEVGQLRGGRYRTRTYDLVRVKHAL